MQTANTLDVTYNVIMKITIPHLYTYNAYQIDG